MTDLVNVTPHDVTVFALDGAALACWPASGLFARVIEHVQNTDPLETGFGSIPSVAVRYSDAIDGLPTPEVGTAFIVSRVTAAAVAREDLYFPYDEVRDDAGRVVGCRALGRFVHGDRGIPDA